MQKLPIKNLTAKFGFICLISLNLICSDIIANSSKFVIGCRRNSAGFFALFISALSHLAWCEKNNKIPVLYWGKNCVYYEPHGYKESFNAWEYYFDPVSELTYETNDIIHNSFLDHSGKGFAPGKGETHCFPQYKKIYSANKIIQKYIRVKDDIKNKVDNFVQENIRSNKTIGIHIRGTDKKNELPTTDINLILAEANKHQGYQFFIATDEQRFLDQAKAILNGKVLYYDSNRSTNGKPIHKQKISNKAQLGEEVLIEALILAQCDKFLHTCSNVSTAVHYFNPKLESIFFVGNKQKYHMLGDSIKKFTN